MSKFKRYTMVIRRDSEGFATPALKVRQDGEVLKFDEVKELLKPNSDYTVVSRINYLLNGSDSAESKLRFIKEIVNSLNLPAVAGCQACKSGKEDMVAILVDGCVTVKTLELSEAHGYTYKV
ncbi:MAG: hypothetical protein NTX52_13395 [Planctomycetota bacterium]|nr:hypothetical protein [Planctomycetota bacterium]